MFNKKKYYIIVIFLSAMLATYLHASFFRSLFLDMGISCEDLIDSEDIAALDGKVSPEWMIL